MVAVVAVVAELVEASLSKPACRSQLSHRVEVSLSRLVLGKQYSHLVVHIISLSNYRI